MWYKSSVVEESTQLDRKYLQHVKAEDAVGIREASAHLSLFYILSLLKISVKTSEAIEHIARCK